MSFVSPPYEVLKCNFHCHFSWHNQLMLRRPSGLSTLRAFHDAGFDVVALTEHSKESNLGLEKETQKAWADADDHDALLVVVGCELSFGQDARGRFGGGDCVALFLEDYVDCLSAPGCSAQPLEWVMDKVHAQGGLAIIAHHTSSHSRTRTGEGLWHWRKKFPIDGWEIFNGSCSFAGRPEVAFSHPEEAVEEDCVALSAADSHTPFQANCSCASCTYVFVAERSLEALKEALIHRRVVAFCDGFLYGKPDWVERFKAWRRENPPGKDDLLCRGLISTAPNEDEAIKSLDRLTRTYSHARFSTEAFQKELLALSDLTWRSRRSARFRHAIGETLAALSQRMFQLDEQAMLDWYKRSYLQGLAGISANPRDAAAFYKAGQAGAFFPGVISSFDEARQHLEQALAIDPALHVARAALVNLLAKAFPQQALEHCRKGLGFPDASPYLVALERHLLRQSKG